LSLNLKKMKKMLIIGLFILVNLSCKSQAIVPVETRIDYIHTGDGVPETITYFKDVNNLLDKYVGVWKGTLNNINYEFKITKITNKLGRITEDRLLIPQLPHESFRVVL
jgi:hypothetical protein